MTEDGEARAAIEAASASIVDAIKEKQAALRSRLVKPGYVLMSRKLYGVLTLTGARQLVTLPIALLPQGFGDEDTLTVIGEARDVFLREQEAVA